MIQARPKRIRRLLPVLLSASCSTGCLTAAFVLASRSPWAVGTLAVGLGWSAMTASPLAKRLATPCLVASYLLASVALLLGALPGLVGAGAAAALAAWDLATFEASAAATGSNGAPAEDDRELRVRRLRALALGILPGLAIGAAARGPRLDIPFAVMVGLVLLAAASLDRFLRWSR